jgi:enoyl-CoA hydratase/isomerase-like protein
VSDLLTYDLTVPIAAITMDDGKVNCLSQPMLRELNEALSQAAADGTVVLLTGRDGCFSAGFDLPMLRAGGPAARRDHGGHAGRARTHRTRSGTGRSPAGRDAGTLPAGTVSSNAPRAAQSAALVSKLRSASLRAALGPSSARTTPIAAAG